MDQYFNRRVPRTMTSSEDDQVAVFYNQAFESLIEEISDKLIKEKNIYFITQLGNRFSEILKSKGVENSKLYTTKLLKNLLLKQFGSSIQILSQRGHASIIYSSEITVSQMCFMASKLQSELDESEYKIESDSSDEEDVAHPVHTDSFAVAKHFRTEMKKKSLTQKKTLSNEAIAEEELQSREPSRVEISYEAASKCVPDDLYNHVARMITQTGADFGTEGRVELKRAEHERVLNISQDLMSQVTNVPLLKHIGIALHVLRQVEAKT